MMEVHIRNGLTKKELTAEVLMEMWVFASRPSRTSEPLTQW